MPIIDIVLVLTYMLPVLFALDKNKLKAALLLFIFLMVPIFLKIYVVNFEYFAPTQIIFWSLSVVFLKFFKLFRN